MQLITSLVRHKEVGKKENAKRKTCYRNSCSCFLCERTTARQTGVALRQLLPPKHTRSHTHVVRKKIKRITSIAFSSAASKCCSYTKCHDQVSDLHTEHEYLQQPIQTTTTNAREKLIHSLEDYYCHFLEFQYRL